MTELTVGVFLIGLALGILLGIAFAQRLLAAKYAQLLTELAAVKALRIRLRGRG